MAGFRVQFYFAGYGGGLDYSERDGSLDTTIERDGFDRAAMILEITKSLHEYGFYTVEKGQSESVVISAAVLRYFTVWG